MSEVLERSRQLGFLGPAPVGGQIEHALRFGPALAAMAARRVVDLGAGGGLPSLPLAATEELRRFVLVDSSRKRTSFLVWAVIELGLADRVEVWCGRAEDFAHDPERRFGFDAVIARGFGPPPSTVECAAPLLRPGGRAVVSEPPGGREWSEGGMASVGLVEVESPDGLAVFERRGEVDDVYPRPVKARQSKPLFDP